MMVGGTDPKGRDALKGEETLRRGTLKGGRGAAEGGHRDTNGERGGGTSEI